MNIDGNQTGKQTWTGGQISIDVGLSLEHGIALLSFVVPIRSYYHDSILSTSLALSYNVYDLTAINGYPSSAFQIEEKGEFPQSYFI